MTLEATVENIVNNELMRLFKVHNYYYNLFGKGALVFAIAKKEEDLKIYYYPLSLVPPQYDYIRDWIDELSSFETGLFVFEEAREINTVTFKPWMENALLNSPHTYQVDFRKQMPDYIGFQRN